jgi:hypothetical protein
MMLPGLWRIIGLHKTSVITPDQELSQITTQYTNIKLQKTTNWQKGMISLLAALPEHTAEPFVPLLLHWNHATAMSPLASDIALHVGALPTFPVPGCACAITSLENALALHVEEWTSTATTNNPKVTIIIYS